jgi:membrane-associated protease RseP (regulator of RpoE activity)
MNERLAAAPACCLLFVAIFPSSSRLEAEEATVLEENLRRHVAFLASDELGGRDSGEPGLEVAAEYVALRFKEFGLAPAGDGGTYFQYFTAPGGAGLGLDPRAFFAPPLAEGRRDVLPWVEAFPFGFGDDVSSGVIRAPVVFAGYGVSVKKEDTRAGRDYDDFAGLDLKGKVVLVLRFLPRWKKEDPLLAEERKESEHAPFSAKLRSARRHGAAAVIFITPPGRPDDERDLLGLARQAAPDHPTLPALLVKTALARELLARAGKDLDAVTGDIDRTLEPRSFEIPGLELRLETTRGQRVLRNVAGYLSGPEGSPLAGETIVIGGHYDHIGRYGGQVSPRNIGEIHNGADDNASGTAGVLELARVFAARGRAPGRSLLFLAFSGEEIGLLGSRYFVRAPRRFVTRERAPSREALAAEEHGGDDPARSEGEAEGFVEAGTILEATGEGRGGWVRVKALGAEKPVWTREDAITQVEGPLPLHRVAAMINLDMIGHASAEKPVQALGAASSPAFAPLLEKLSAELGVPVRAEGKGIPGGGSDHWHFLGAGIPVVFFWSGWHSHYNQPTDDPGTIEYAGMRGVVDLARGVVAAIAESAERPPFAKPAEVAAAGHGGGEEAGRARLGIEVDAEFEGSGVRVKDTQAETPAAEAGVEPGDVIVSIGDDEIRALPDLLAALEDAPRGRDVPLKIRRDGSERTLQVLFPSPRGGFGVSFGSVPDYAWTERGVRFEAIREGTAAARAGVQKGDVLVLWNGEEVEDVRHWTELLGKHKPGDEVKISLRRGDKVLELTVKLEGRG